MSCSDSCQNEIHRQSRTLIWIDLCIDLVFFIIFVIFLIRLLIKPCQKAVRFSNSFKIISLYLLVMILGVS